MLDPASTRPIAVFRWERAGVVFTTYERPEPGSRYWACGFRSCGAFATLEGSQSDPCPCGRKGIWYPLRMGSSATSAKRSMQVFIAAGLLG